LPFFYFAGETAVTRDAFGHGAVYYVGTVLDTSFGSLDRFSTKTTGLSLRAPGRDFHTVRKLKLAVDARVTSDALQVSLPARHSVSALSDRRIPGDSIKLGPGAWKYLLR
jgi:hypothetical protein